MIRVVVWHEDQMKPAWFNGGKFYSYDGTWFHTEKDRLDGVEYWNISDWMEAGQCPSYGPGVKRYLSYWWSRATNKASDMTVKLRHRKLGNAQLTKKVVYFHNARTGEIRMGLPEQFPVSKGFDRVVCNSTHEAEVWSDKLRKYNVSKESRHDERREEFEGAIRKEIRSNIQHLMANSHSKIGKEFMGRYLDRMERTDRTRMTREEYLHSEGYEQGR